MSSERVMTAEDAACGHFVAQGIAVPVDPLLRMQGYRDPARIRPDVREIAARAAALAETLLIPEAYYKRLKVRACSDAALTLAAGATFHGAEFSKVLAGCREVIVFVLTLGSRLDEATDSHVKNDEIVDALFLETAGWLAVERATRSFAQHLWSRFQHEGYRLTRRLGPGYFDWPLEEQEALFGLFQGVALPVRLLESCAMIPKKSRSGLYGLAASSLAASS